MRTHVDTINLITTTILVPVWLCMCVCLLVLCMHRSYVCGGMGHACVLCTYTKSIKLG